MNSIHFRIQIFRYPFDVKNPIGYLCACVTQYIGLTHYLYFTSFAVSSQIGVYLLVTTFHKDLKNNLKSINGNAKPKANRAKNFKHFCNMIGFHSFLIQLSNKSFWSKVREKYEWNAVSIVWVWRTLKWKLQLTSIFLKLSMLFTQWWNN